MTDAEKALERARREAHEAVAALTLHDIHEKYGRPMVAIDRALDLARKVGALTQANDCTNNGQFECEPCGLVRGHLQREIDEATRD